MAYAVYQAKADDTIWVQDSGVIARNVVIDKDLNIFGTGGTLRQLTAGVGAGRHFDIQPEAFVRMKDLELTGGSATNGGSIVNAGNLVLLDCTLRDNTATESGGAISNQSDLVLNHTTLENNVAGSDGGGIANEEGGILSVTNDSFLGDNDAGRYGGGIYLGGQSAGARIENSTLTGNFANQTGGAVFAEDGVFSVTESTLDMNMAGSRGGAIYTLVQLLLSRTSLVGNEAANGGAILFDADAKHSIEHCTFAENIAVSYGGAINATNGELSIVASEFESNQGAVGGAIAFTEMASYSILDNHYLSNQAVNGGGAIADLTTLADATASISASTFENNAATGSWATGGAIALNTPGEGTVVNCTFFGNSAAAQGGAIYAGSDVDDFHMGNVTIADGSAAEGGAIYAYGVESGGFVVTNSLLTRSEDASGAHCVGELGGYGNLVGTEVYPSAPGWDSTCGSVVFSSTGATGVGTALGEHGGPTIGVNDAAMRTLELLSGSSAADAGVSSCDFPEGTPLNTDERGRSRPGSGKACDVGAFEIQ